MKPTFLQGVMDAEKEYNNLYCKRKLWNWFDEECRITQADHRWNDWREGAYFYLCHIEKNNIKPRGYLL